jgi:hypothetical protein
VEGGVDELLCLPEVIVHLFDVARFIAYQEIFGLVK